MAIQGHVYNITPYLAFHPGGVPELLRGAGADATQLFNEVHAWVNHASMLEKCLVGFLVPGRSAEDSRPSRATLTVPAGPARATLAAPPA